MPLGIHTCALGGGGRLAGGERRPGLANKRRHAPFGLTTSRLVVVVVWPEVAPVSGDGEVAAARPLRLGFQQG
jgi:hypothetical protein